MGQIGLNSAKTDFFNRIDPERLFTIKESCHSKRATVTNSFSWLGPLDES
jgi:hypothetical protein